MSLADVVDMLACPACGGRGVGDVPFRIDGSTLRCPEGHAYDFARQGHVNLLGRAVPRNADGPDMVAARERFLNGGAYDRVADALVDAALAEPSAAAPAVLDVGAGPGWYLDRVLAGAAEREPGRGLALDVSPAAARRAARSRGRVGAVVADAWEPLPVRTASVDAVLSVFAPRRPAELARVLAPGGRVVVVSPLPDHLAELRRAFGLLDVEEGKQDRLASTFGEHLTLAEGRDLRYPVRLSREAAEDLVAMGPNAFHVGQRAADGAHRDLPGPVTVAVRVDTWTLRAGRSPRARAALTSARDDATVDAGGRVRPSRRLRGP